MLFDIIIFLLSVLAPFYINKSIVNWTASYIDAWYHIILLQITNFKIVIFFTFHFSLLNWLGYNIFLYFFIAFIIIVGYGVITAGKYAHPYICVHVGVYVQLWKLMRTCACLYVRLHAWVCESDHLNTNMNMRVHVRVCVTMLVRTPFVRAFAVCVFSRWWDEILLAFIHRLTDSILCFSSDIYDEGFVFIFCHDI